MPPRLIEIQKVQPIQEQVRPDLGLVQIPEFYLANTIQPVIVTNIGDVGQQVVVVNAPDQPVPVDVENAAPARVWRYWNNNWAYGAAANISAGGSKNLNTWSNINLGPNGANAVGKFVNVHYCLGLSASTDQGQVGVFRGNITVNDEDQTHFFPVVVNPTTTDDPVTNCMFSFKQFINAASDMTKLSLNIYNPRNVTQQLGIYVSVLTLEVFDSQ